MIIKTETFIASVKEILNNDKAWKTIKVTSKKKEGDLFKSVKGSNGFGFFCLISGTDLPLIEGTKVKFTCSVTTKNGQSYYNCQYWEYVKPESINSIKSYLTAKLSTVKVLSRQKIAEIVSKYGKNALELFETGNKTALFPFFCPKGGTYEGISSLEKAIEIISTDEQDNDFVREMSKLGINPTKSRKIMSHLGIHSIDELKEDPYQCLDIPGFGFATVDDIAIALGADLCNERRIIEGTKYAISKKENGNGDLFIDVNIAKQETLKELYKRGGVKITDEQWKTAINNDKKTKNPNFLVFKGNIMLSEDNNDELMACRYLKTLTRYNSQYEADFVKKLANDLNDKQEKVRGFKLSEEQIQAVVNALCNKVSIITGGPGTGKSTILGMIIQLWNTLSREPITCMAPTGKAATRMTETTGVPAYTIHKTIKIIPTDDSGEVNENKLQKISRGLVVIDESSMIDQKTLTRLLSCIENGSTVIFLGDIDQLPSVGKGDVLNQMIASGHISVSRLTVTKRQGEDSPIIANAAKINHCETTLKWDEELFKFVKGSDDDVDKIVNIYKTFVDQYGVEQVALLCPRRARSDKQYKVCSDYMNSIIADAINPARKTSKGIEINNGKQIIKFYKGDRVMSWKNKDEIANGDIGVITSIQEDEFHQFHFMIDWGNERITDFSSEDMKDCSLAYAMSIHKSQGSEYQCVIMPILSQQYQQGLFTKNLLYTGVTRAKKKVIIFGDELAINKTIKNNSTTKRKSFLAQRLQMAA